MERLFFRLCRKLETKIPNKWLIDAFIAKWARHMRKHELFILCYHSFFEKIIKIALQQCQADFQARSWQNNDFLLRYQLLSICIDHFEKTIRPLLIHKLQFPITNIVQNANQCVLDMILHATPSNDGLTRSPGITDT